MHIRTIFALKQYAYLRMDWPIDRNINVNAVVHNRKAALNEKNMNASYKRKNMQKLGYLLNSHDEIEISQYLLI